MWEISWLVLLWLAGVTGQDCCPEGLWLVSRSSLCSDNNSSINLECSNGRFMLDPTIENFTINGALHSDAVPGRFCKSRLQNLSGSVSPHEVVLACFPEPSVTPHVLQIFMGISSVCLLLTFLVYVAVPELRDLQGKCQMAMVLSLALAYISLIVVQTDVHSAHHVCVFQAFWVYFWTLSAFFWINASTFNIWRSVTLSHYNMGEGRWLLLYVAWGYGVPGLFITASLIAELTEGDHFKPNFGVSKCWFQGREENWSFFYGPVALLLVLNLVLFLLTCRTLWHDYKNESAPRIRSLRFKCCLYLKLFLLMGVIWVFEVISFAMSEPNSGEDDFWIFTDSLNCLQGVAIFLILIVFRKRVRLHLARHQTCGIRWPPSWAAEQDIETDTVSSKEETELAMQN